MSTTRAPLGRRRAIHDDQRFCSALPDLPSSRAPKVKMQHSEGHSVTSSNLMVQPFALAHQEKPVLPSFSPPRLSSLCSKESNVGDRISNCNTLRLTPTF